MVARVDEPALRRRPAGPRALSRGTRLLFVFGLLVFGMTSLYTSLALLARVTPALFPGQTLSDVLPGPLPADKIVANPGPDSVFNRRINILVLGLDARPQQEADATLPTEERFKARSDTLMVASVDPVTQTTNFLSFPRDMVIDVYPKQGGKYRTRINESFLEGLQSGKSIEAGAEQVQRDLEKNFGIETDYWAVLDFRGVAEVIDAMGGVDVNVPEDLAIPGWWYSDDDVTHRFITIPPGPQKLDGYMAVALSRNRDPNDLARIKRQQLVMEAAVSKAFSQGLLSPTRWPGLWDAYKDTLKTDVPNGRLPGYANLLRQTKGHMKAYSLGDPVGDRPTVWDGNLGGAAVLFWDPENVKYWISRAFPNGEYGNATVEVRNGRSQGGAPESLAIGRFLEVEKALPTVYVGPDAEAQAHSQLLVYGDDRRKLAEDIAEWLNLPETAIQEFPRDDQNLPDVELIVGDDLDGPPASQVAQAGG
jgi:LCP family protein required for cell wall assembly